MAGIAYCERQEVAVWVSKKELDILMDGLLSLIDTTSKAKACVYDTPSIGSLNNAIGEYQELLNKLSEVKTSE